ncbi:hypothetical protein KC19_8G182300 [Ceratodon purpureus]|uniref:Uncharacterized protein n=1 Tax=Ceratodon purpureus TaxID=3225 RepID=A0A8T0H5A7_CERPU|nr:hypothetical protein KC19_8G182300 [Ceratodon purpureus]
MRSGFDQSHFELDMHDMELGFSILDQSFVAICAVAWSIKALERILGGR